MPEIGTFPQIIKKLVKRYGVEDTAEFLIQLHIEKFPDASKARDELFSCYLAVCIDACDYIISDVSQKSEIDEGVDA